MRVLVLSSFEGWEGVLRDGYWDPDIGRAGHRLGLLMVLVMAASIAILLHGAQDSEHAAAL
jgi:hypothetical protein